MGWEVGLINGCNIDKGAGHPILWLFFYWIYDQGYQSAIFFTVIFIDSGADQFSGAYIIAVPAWDNYKCICS